MSPQDARVERVAGVETVWFGDVCVVFDPATNTVRRLNPSAASVWRSLEQPRRRADLITMVFDGSSATGLDASRSVDQFCDDLLAWGLAREAE